MERDKMCDHSCFSTVVLLGEMCQFGPFKWKSLKSIFLGNGLKKHKNGWYQLSLGVTMQPKTLWDKLLGHMSIQSKFTISRAWKPFPIVAAPYFTEDQGPWSKDQTRNLSRLWSQSYQPQPQCWTTFKRLPW